MVGSILSVVVLVALVVLFIWLAVRAGRARRAWVKWPAMLLSGLLGLVFLTVTVVALIGLYRLNFPPHAYQKANVQVELSEANVARGQRLAAMCADCHSTTGVIPLDGSQDNFLAGGPPFGVLYAPNLTPGGPLKDWTDGEILRAIREGVDKDGRPLMIMPSQAMHALSDADAQALVAYLRSQPTVNRQVPVRDTTILAALVVGSGMFPTSAQTPITGPVTAPPPGTVDHGEYLVAVSGCADCHGPGLTGTVTNSFVPPGPNLTQIVPSWTREQFITLIRTGVDPNGRKIDPDQMPWKSFNKAYTDEELSDMFSFIHGLQRVDHTQP